MLKSAYTHIINISWWSLTQPHHSQNSGILCWVYISRSYSHSLAIIVIMAKIHIRLCEPQSNDETVCQFFKIKISDIMMDHIFFHDMLSYNKPLLLILTSPWGSRHKTLHQANSYICVTQNYRFLNTRLPELPLEKDCRSCHLHSEKQEA